MIASMACFISNDAIMKTFADEMTLFQALAYRGWIGILICLLIALAIDGRITICTLANIAITPTVAARIACEITSTIFFLLALFALDLANATAIIQTLPLMITIGGALFFREAVGWRRWVATAAGFLGVLMIVQPGTEGFSWASIYALAAAVAMTARDLFTKAMPDSIPSTYVNLLTTAAVWFMALGVAPFQGPMPDTDASVWLRLSFAALFIGVGFLTAIMTVRVGEISFVAPFRYTILIWALLLGYFIFDEVPNTLALIGAAIVVAAGIYAFYRERLSARNSAILADTAPVSTDSH